MDLYLITLPHALGLLRGTDRRVRKKLKKREQVTMKKKKNYFSVRAAAVRKARGRRARTYSGEAAERGKGSESAGGL